MKQHITPEQLNELSEEQKERLREWWSPKEGQLVVHYEKGVYDKAYENEELVININEDSEMDFSFNILDQYYKKGDCLPLLSIGQMIELLEERNPKYLSDVMIFVFTSKTIIPNFEKDQDKANMITEMINRIELCDALWQAVKEVL